MLITLRREDYPLDVGWWNEDPQALRFAENLADVVRFGHHAVKASPKLLVCLADIPKLSENQRRALERAAVHNQRGDLPLDEALDPLRIVGPMATDDLNREELRWWRWTRFASLSEPLGRVILLAEDLADARYFVWLARAWGARQRPTLLHAGQEVSLEPENGGGDNTGTVFRHKVSTGRLVLAIVDSDKDAQTATPGATARKVLKEADNLLSMDDGHCCRAELLNAHTLEHLLPLDLVEDIGGHEAHWLRPMLARGFFARPDVDPALCFLNLGKVQRETDLCAECRGEVLAYRERAIRRIRELDSTCQGTSTEILVHSVGKLPRSAVTRLEDLQRLGTKDGGAAHWLAARLPASDAAVLDPARLAWSWGLSMPERIRAAP